jgi:hypothetical protein
MLPKLAAGVPAFQRREPIPIGPFTAHNLFRLDHAKELSIPAGGSSVVLAAIPKSEIESPQREHFLVEFLQSGICAYAQIPD